MEECSWYQNVALQTYYTAFKAISYESFSIL